MVTSSNHVHRQYGKPMWAQLVMATIPQKVTAWELELRRRGLTETAAIMALRNHAAQDLNTWVRANQRSVYIPEAALLAVGLPIHVS